MEPENIPSSPGIARLRIHAHLAVVFISVCLSLLLVDRLVSGGARLSQGEFGAGYLAVLFSILLPFALYWLVGKVSGWRDFPCIFLDFVLSLPAAFLLFPHARGKGFLLFSGLLLAAAFVMTVVGEHRRTRRREARRAAAAAAQGHGEPPGRTEIHATTRLETYKEAARPAPVSPGRMLLLGGIGLLLVLGVEYLYVLAVRGMVNSPNYRTRYTAYLVILSLPAVLYWVVELAGCRPGTRSLFVQGVLALGVLLLLLPGEPLAYQLLWYPPACYGLVFLMDRMDKKRRVRRYTGILLRRPPGVRPRRVAPTAGEPLPPRGSARTAALETWTRACHNIYTLFRPKRG